MKKELPQWRSYSVKSVDVLYPDNIDEVLTKHDVDGDDVISIVEISAHRWGGPCLKVFYKEKVN